MPNVSIPPTNLQLGQPVHTQTGNIFVQTTTATGQVCYFNVKTRVSTWERPQNACIMSQVAWEIVRSNMTETERLGTAEVPHTNVQRNAAMDSDISDESDEEVVEEKKKHPEIVEEKKVEPKPGQKPVNKRRPVSSTPIPGTVWCVVETDDGKCFFYDPSKRHSVWKRPEELKNRPDVDKLLLTKPEVKTEKMQVKNVQEEPPSKKIRSEAEVKEVKEESNHEVTQQIVLGAEATMIPEVEASQHSSVVQLEVRMKQFKDLLAENIMKNDFMKRLKEIAIINHITTWSDMKSKLSSDPYYEDLFNIPRGEDWFQEYSKNQQDMKNNFMKCLSEIPGINHCTTWNYVKSKMISDPRYEALFSHSLRVNWFWEYLKILNDAKNDFMKRLREIPGIDDSTTWSDVKSKVSSDSSCETLFSDSHRENWFQEYLKNLNDAKNDFTKMLSEIPDINHHTTWSDVESKVSSDPRYKAVSDSQREDLFRQYLKTVNEVKNDYMRRLSKIPDINNSTTWNNVNSKVSSDPRYAALFSDSHRMIWFQEYLQLKNDFMKKLREIPGIDHSTTWSDVESKVSSDPSCEALISDSHREIWFQELLKNLNDEKNDFMKMLSEIPDINHHTTWSDVESKVSSDSRYKAVDRDSQREALFREYLKIVNDVKNDFMKRLNKTPGINHSTLWSHVKSSVSYDTVQHFIPLYNSLFSDSHREKWFQEYLKNLCNVKDDFMKMLSEIPDINHNTTWSDVKSKVSSDPRYKAVVCESHQKNWFKAHLQRLYDVKYGFMKMLSEMPDINHHTTWSDVESKVSSDPRYKAVVSDSQREDFFREYLKTVNDVKNDFMKSLSKISRKDISTTWRYVKFTVTSDPLYAALFNDSHRENWFQEYLQAKNDFMKSLNQIPDIDHSTTWSDVKSKVSSDPSCEVLFSDFYLENWFEEYLKNLNDEKNDFMEMLSEIPGINQHTTWSDVESKVSSDPRYKAVVSESQREDWFREYLKTVNDLKIDFMIRLIEVPDINNRTIWRDVKWIVYSDIRYKTYVSDSHQEDWFQEYLTNLNNVKNDFMIKLSEIPDINNSTSWDDVKSKMSLDPQCEALFSDSHRQNWFREYFETLSDMKNDFMKRLRKIPGIKTTTPWSSVKKYMVPYQGYEAFSDSHLENWFKEYLKARIDLSKVKNDFMKRLSKLLSIDHSTTWSDVKSKISLAPCPKALFGDSDFEDWFGEFLKNLIDAKNDFIKSLSSIPGINNKTTWGNVKSKLSSDPHSETLFGDYHREKWFWEYVNNLNDEAGDLCQVIAK